MPEIEYTSFEGLHGSHHYYYDQEANKVQYEYYDFQDDDIDNPETKTIDINNEISDLIGWLFYEKEEAEKDLKKLKQEISESKDLKIAIEYRKQVKYLLNNLETSIKTTTKAIEKVSDV